MRGYGDKIGFNFWVFCWHSCSSCFQQIAIKGSDRGAKNNGGGIFAVCARRNAVCFAKRSCKSLVGRKSVTQSYIKYADLGIANLFKRKSKSAVTHIIPERHTRKLAEFPRNIVFGIPESLGKVFQREFFVVILLYTFVDFKNQVLYVFQPFCHDIFPFCLIIVSYFKYLRLILFAQVFFWLTGRRLWCNILYMFP